MRGRVKVKAQPTLSRQFCYPLFVIWKCEQVSPICDSNDITASTRRKRTPNIQRRESGHLSLTSCIDLNNIIIFMAEENTSNHSPNNILVGEVISCMIHYFKIQYQLNS
jgi:hypothetical protein